MFARPLFVASMGLVMFGCGVHDADLSTSAALIGLDFTASTDLLLHRQTHITGQMTLGYTSTQLVQLRILDNGLSAYADSVPAASAKVPELTLPIDQTIDLLADGPNEITVEATYNGQTVQKKTVVTVPAPIQAFKLNPAASAVNVFQVGLTGSATFGYLSARPATLEIAVEGATVHVENVDASTNPSATVNVTVPLLREGANRIAATLRYSGQELTQKTLVTMAWDAPTLGPTTWTETYVKGVSLTETATAAITAAPAYKIDSVSVSVDGGTPFPAPVAAAQASIVVVNPDIGDDTVAITVATSDDAHVQQTTFYRPLPVSAKFDCLASSMLPASTLVRNVGTEQRDMVGYWGDPGGGHTIGFLLTAQSWFNNGPQTLLVLGKPTSYGRFYSGVELGIGQYRCQNPPCQIPYALTATVDGKQICTQANYGVIQEY